MGDFIFDNIEKILFLIIAAFVVFIYMGIQGNIERHKEYMNAFDQGKTPIVYKLKDSSDDVKIFEKAIEKGYTISDNISSTHESFTAAPVITGKTSGVIAIPSTKNSQIVIFVKGK